MEKQQVKAISVALGLIVLAILGMLVGSMLSSLIPFPSESIRLGVTIAISQGIGMGVLSILYMKNRYETLSVFKFNLDIKQDVLMAGALAALLIISSIIVSYITTFVGVQTAENTIQSTLESSDANIYIFMLASVLIVGPLEELFFRGTIQRRLKDNFKPMYAIIITAFLFANVHLMSMVGSNPISFLSYLVVLFIGGIALGWAYEETENLAVPMVGHGLYNAILSVGLLFA